MGMGYHVSMPAIELISLLNVAANRLKQKLRQRFELLSRRKGRSRHQKARSLVLQTRAAPSQLFAVGPA